MTTYFDTLERSYVDVDLSKGINTEQFLQATEGLVKLFDLLGSSAFSVVQKDMNGNIKKIRDRYLTNPSANATLQDLMATEAPEKKRTATEGLLWLTRGLDFTAQALRRSVDNPEEELTVSFTQSYEQTLKKFHNMLVRPVFALAMKACPYRKDFYQKIGVTNEAGLAQMKQWLEALENIIRIIQEVFKANPAYIKGM
ncbi:glycolipid transfer protein domain-containing protein [Gilbertella persicaria]|uniref:glycolipid transfer protein domain-containing protein n=1 Tax=Gilbertella persicaria TaxID=101096 RepID=UPI0022206880|nr:glycolipid transfer protein domain-containing protein [Gilbertella persicaria]KAI8084186.1 glycolipid transfer protein domain-containing protein [Gilbertella persicaria]